MSLETSCLHDLFKIQAETTPNSVAVVDGDTTITYKELDRLTDSLAAYFQLQKVTLGSRVGIFLDKSSEYILATIATLKAGASCANLELSYPDSLLTQILERVAPTVVITKSCYAKRLQANYPFVILEIDRDSSWKSRAYNPESVPPMSSEQLALIWHSSGTTGVPKSVLVPHRSVLHFCHQREEVVTCKSTTRYGCNSYLSWEIFRSLLKGAAFYVIGDSIIREPKKLIDFVRQFKLNEILITPSMLQEIINNLTSDEISLGTSSLDVVWIGGEALATKLRDNALEIFPSNVQFVNMYGMTECATIAIHTLKQGEDSNREFCPVGFPHQGTIIRLLDENMKEVNVGEVGELYAQSPCLADGYLGDSEQTAKHFATIDGSKFYRTGDLAVILPDGKLEIKGRCSSKVKLGNYSVHLGMVENALLKYAQVKSCLVTAYGDGENKKLVAYLVRQDDADWTICPDSKSCLVIQEQLKSALPDYAIPKIYIELESLPINPVSGKVNRQSLPSPSL